MNYISSKGFGAFGSVFLFFQRLTPPPCGEQYDYKALSLDYQLLLDCHHFLDRIFFEI